MKQTTSPLVIPVTQLFKKIVANVYLKKLEMQSKMRPRHSKEFKKSYSDKTKFFEVATAEGAELAQGMDYNDYRTQ